MQAWDSYDAYLFDIDGTLLNCTDAVHYFAFCEALTALAGRPLNLDGVNAHGNTDVGILRDALVLARVPDSEWRPRLAETRAAMCQFVQRNRADFQIRVLPAARAVLDHLTQRGAVLGVATGNLEGIGKAKLDTAGLLQYFRFAGWSDAHEHRRDVFRAALEEARSIAGPNATVCVVGDTPLDISAAQGNGLDVIAVATGVFPYEQLHELHPTRCVHSLQELLSATVS